MSQLAEFVIVLVGSFSVILTLMAIFFFVLISKYRRNLLKKQNEALTNFIMGQDEERQRLARDLHDEMGPQLSNIIFTIDQIKNEDPKVQAVVAETKLDIKKSIQDIRNIAHNLMSQSLLRFGLTEAIQEMIERQSENAIKVVFKTNSDGTEYDDAIKSHLFKITQEMVYNSNKHSKASLIEIEITLDPAKRYLEYTYQDNGVGSSDSLPTVGIGIKNIRTRVELMKGQFELTMHHGFFAKITLNY